MMLPGVELARRRRFHNRSDVYVPGPLESSSSRLHPTVPPLPIDEPAAAAARRRLEEKLRGPFAGPRSPSSSLSSPSSPSSPSSFHRWMMRTSTATTQDNSRPIHSGHDSSTALSPRSTVLSQHSTALSPRSALLSPRSAALSPRSTVLSPRNINKGRRGGELTRRGSRADICAVCLDGFEASQHTIWLPCAHRYHSSCVLPWLADHSQCPYCRTEMGYATLLTVEKESAWSHRTIHLGLFVSVALAGISFMMKTISAFFLVLFPTVA
ncbi:hypothetical protein HPP92_006121 [Vanilla planifolia]|uniref:RING-type domain-containing protein n=1 Tax=Vanilla planifolia TaxID=51239 RepID=A0A835RV88_VANPL|nr:hypothetical protein HPP92_006121 [Vanilla planifolia]